MDPLTKIRFVDNIHPVHGSDLPAVMEIERSCFLDPWPVNWFQAILRCRDHFSGFFNDTGPLVGYAISVIEDDQLHIANLAVHVDFRRQGIAKSLIKDAILFGISKNSLASFLEVRESNHSAIALYLSLGFVRERVEEFYYENGENALILVRRNDGVV